MIITSRIHYNGLSEKGLHLGHLFSLYNNYELISHSKEGKCYIYCKSKEVMRIVKENLDILGLNYTSNGYKVAKFETIDFSSLETIKKISDFNDTLVEGGFCFYYHQNGKVYLKPSLNCTNLGEIQIGICNDDGQSIQFDFSYSVKIMDIILNVNHILMVDRYRKGNSHNYNKPYLHTLDLFLKTTLIDVPEINYIYIAGCNIRNYQTTNSPITLMQLASLGITPQVFNKFFQSVRNLKYTTLEKLSHIWKQYLDNSKGKQVSSCYGIRNPAVIHLESPNNKFTYYVTIRHASSQDYEIIQLPKCIIVDKYKLDFISGDQKLYLNHGLILTDLKQVECKEGTIIDHHYNAKCDMIDSSRNDNTNNKGLLWWISGENIIFKKIQVINQTNWYKNNFDSPLSCLDKNQYLIAQPTISGKLCNSDLLYIPKYGYLKQSTPLKYVNNLPVYYRIFDDLPNYNR